MSSDSARLRVPFGAGRRRTAFDGRGQYSGGAGQAGSNYAGKVIIAILVLALGAGIGYLVSENSRLKQEAAVIPERTQAVKSAERNVKSGTVKGVEKAVEEKSSSAAPAGEAKTDGVKDATGVTETTASSKVEGGSKSAKSAPKRRIRSLFPGAGLSTADDYVAGEDGHQAKSLNIWIVKVGKIEQKTDGNWNIIFNLSEVLKGEQKDPSTTLTILSLNPWREFKLPPGDASLGTSMVAYLDSDGGFFFLSNQDYARVKEKD